MAGLRAGILSAPPIWEQVWTRPEPEPLAALAERSLGVLFSGTTEYLESHSGALLLFGLIACALFVLALQLRRLGRSTADADGALTVVVTHRLAPGKRTHWIAPMTTTSRLVSPFSLTWV